MRVIVEDVPGLEVAAAYDDDGQLWVVIGSEVSRPYHAYADLMEELAGCLPDRLTFEKVSPCPPVVPLPRSELGANITCAL